ncbi:hypothetical protein [Ideonella sp.]|uniref:hypothetical protein n=1 Tax=Ideonella sp. TaxID=1929293 RepID=UPI0035B21CC8
MSPFTALRCFVVGLLLGVVAVATNTAHAQPAATAWADPTRPAGALAAEASASAPRAARAASAASAAAAAPQLQSLQVNANGQSTALVDGRVVQAGDTLGGARIVAIDADGLTLRDAKGRTERMLLISASIAKRDSSTPAPMATAPHDARPATAPSNGSRPVAALATGAAVTAGPIGRGGREGQRP